MYDTVVEDTFRRCKFDIYIKAPYKSNNIRKKIYK